MDGEIRKEVVEFIVNNEDLNPHELMLRKPPFPDVDLKFLAQQIQGRKVAKRKFPFLLNHSQYKYPPKESLEQSSSETIARFKAKLMGGETFVDLTGGMGIDTIILGAQFDKKWYVEPNQELCALNTHNFKALNFPCKVRNTTCEEFLEKTEEHFDWAYIDPSRRVEGNRKISVQNYQPNIVALNKELLKLADNVLVKLSPMQDVTECIHSVKGIAKIWVIGIRNDVKELLLKLSNKPVKEIEICSVNIDRENTSVYTHKGVSFKSTIEGSVLLKYLYQPHASLVKSNLHDKHAEELGLMKLHPNTHLYTSDYVDTSFQGKVFEVLEEIQLNKKQILAHLPDRKVNILTKNFPLKPEDIKSKFRLKDGGSTYLIAFTDIEERKSAAIAVRVH